MLCALPFVIDRLFASPVMRPVDAGKWHSSRSTAGVHLPKSEIIKSLSQL